METLEKQELEEQEAIMPEGYGEGDDYFQEEDWGKGDKVEADAEPEEQPHEKEEKTERDLRGEAEAYFAKHPGYLGGQMPTAVLNAWLGGTGLGEAFAEYERGKSRAETRKLQRENQVLRQNAAADFGGEARVAQLVQQLQLSYAIGSLLLSTMPGMIADRTGSYAPAYLVLLACSVVSILAVQRTYLARAKS